MLLRIISVLLLAHTLAIGQDAWTVMFPTESQVGVSPSAPVLVRTEQVIDSTTWSTLGYPFLVVRDSIARRVPQQRWKHYQVSGRFSLVDDNTVAWNPRRLLPNTTYRCVLDQREFAFTTSPDVASVSACSMPRDVMRCDQSIQVAFTSPLPRAIEIDSVLIVESLTQAGNWLHIPCVVTSNENTFTIISVGRWLPNAQMRLRVRCSWYAGDTGLDRTYETMVRGASDIVCGVRERNGRSLSSDAASALSRNNRTVLPGDTTFLSAPRVMESHMVFSHWESKDAPWINGDTIPYITLVLSCEDMFRQCRINAVYEYRDSARVRFNIDSLGSIELYRTAGEYIGTIHDTTSMMFPLDGTSLLCVAKPRLHSSVTGWMYQGSVVAACAVVIPTTRAVAVNNLSLNPRFQILQPSQQDMYRLRGSISDVDADPLFDVNDAVRFTTPYEYESAQPGNRTLCVKADRCWEIIGYLDMSAGAPVWFDKGLQEYCLTAELTKPENHVAFFTRRKVIGVGIESVLLGSEDPRDVMKAKVPHPETRIELQREQMIAGLREWVSAVSTTCIIDGVATTRYQARCGDNLRILVHPATHRGQQWRWWSALPKYVIPSGGGGVKPTAYTLVVDGDIAMHDAIDCAGMPLDHREIRLQAAFRQQMVIESIGLRVRVNAQGGRENTRFEQRWFDPLTYYDRDADEPSDGRQLEYVPRRGTPVRIQFSLPLDPLTVYNRSMFADSFDNILLTNPQEQNLDFETYADTNGNTNLLSSTGQFLDIVEFAICDPLSRPRKQALHTGSIDLTIGTAVHSYAGDPLRAVQTFALRRMEIPGYGIKLRSVRLYDDGDWDFWPFVNRGEIYHAVYGGDLSPRSALMTERGFSRLPSCDEQQGAPGECTTPHGDTDGPLSFGDHVLWMQPSWMDQADLAWVRMSTWDEDCKDENDCLVNRMGDVIDSLRLRVAKYNVPVEMAALDWKALIPDIIKTGVDLIDALVVPDEQDDFLAECSFLEDSQTLWGMRGSQAPYITYHHENADYELRGQWYTTRAVVR